MFSLIVIATISIHRSMPTPNLIFKIPLTQTQACSINVKFLLNNRQETFKNYHELLFIQISIMQESKKH